MVQATCNNKGIIRLSDLACLGKLQRGLSARRACPHRAAGIAPGVSPAPKSEWPWSFLQALSESNGHAHEPPQHPERPFEVAVDTASCVTNPETAEATVKIRSALAAKKSLNMGLK